MWKKKFHRTNTFVTILSKINLSGHRNQKHPHFGQLSRKIHFLRRGTSVQRNLQTPDYVGSSSMRFYSNWRTKRSNFGCKFYTGVFSQLLNSGALWRMQEVDRRHDKNAWSVGIPYWYCCCWTCVSLNLLEFYIYFLFEHSGGLDC